ncbi:hypothetical protein K402DRAFT_422341 [Aulographum hederae CBS 113979]|uniref:NAD dependent epimerase/dehydratase n=1 Tax=Aulographum hederae CBS 113979 TaxID=1176131 RepID=A0A6G1GVU0_9PEZI|nr:hypothetical protein K402DRAFT_422341 [Aulographum hederae CBS 113979]
MGSEQIPRLIDSEVGTRTKPVKVLLLGGPRTGTVSLYSACHTLGLRCYHQADLLQDASTRTKHAHLWNEALRCNFLNQGKRYGRVEFDKFLGDYDALGDVPLSFFTDDLIRAYPDAKVVLTNRNPDSWLGSMKSTFFHYFSDASMKSVGILDNSYVGELVRMTVLYLNLAFGEDWNDDATVKRKYKEHYEHVRNVVSKDKLLEFNQPYSWGPLCEFLDLPVPEGDFPRLNTTADLVSLFRKGRNEAFVGLIGKIVMAAVPIIAATAGYVWFVGWKAAFKKPMATFMPFASEV